MVAPAERGILAGLSGNPVGVVRIPFIRASMLPVQNDILFAFNAAGL